jgi:hypothetical protein
MAKELVWLENGSFAAWGRTMCDWIVPNPGPTTFGQTSRHGGFTSGKPGSAITFGLTTVWELGTVSASDPVAQASQPLFFTCELSCSHAQDHACHA